MDIIKKKGTVLVIGLGYRTGLAAANFCASRGCRVLVSDIKTKHELSETMAMLDPSITVYAGRQEPALLEMGVELVILSPGVPAAIPIVTEARKRGVPVIAEIELAFRYIRGRVVAITGTDGKSTTTSLVSHVLSELGIHSPAGGNIGIPLVSLVDSTTPDTVNVVELSSFQLETVDRFRPDVSAILNVSPDHLDRYQGMEEYLNAKIRITENQTQDDYFIYNADDPLVKQGLERIRARKYGFSIRDRESSMYLDENRLVLKDGEKKIAAVDMGRMRIVGVHNAMNTMAAFLMVRSILYKMGKEADNGLIAEACYSFTGLEHRMEVLGEIRGRTFINDSKATTVGALEMALRSIPEGRGIVIVGGTTKGDDYSRLIPSMRGRVKALVLIGQSGEDFSRIFSEFLPERAYSMEDAVEKAVRLSDEGDVIMLSPACASFDMFKSFEERGRMFKQSVERLRGDRLWI